MKHISLDSSRWDESNGTKFVKIQSPDVEIITKSYFNIYVICNLHTVRPPYNHLIGSVKNGDYIELWLYKGQFINENDM